MRLPRLVIVPPNTKEQRQELSCVDTMPSLSGVHKGPDDPQARPTLGCWLALAAWVYGVENAPSDMSPRMSEKRAGETKNAGQGLVAPRQRHWRCYCNMARNKRAPLPRCSTRLFRLLGGALSWAGWEPRAESTPLGKRLGNVGSSFAGASSLGQHQDCVMYECSL